MKIYIETLGCKVNTYESEVIKEEFLKNGYGYLVQDSEKGILDGMQQFTKGSLKTLKKFNAIEFNKKALQEFKYLIK